MKRKMGCRARERFLETLRKRPEVLTPTRTWADPDLITFSVKVADDVAYADFYQWLAGHRDVVPGSIVANMGEPAAPMRALLEQRGFPQRSTNSRGVDRALREL